MRMIILTSLNGKEFCLNSDLIYKIRETPDTIVTLTDGKTLRVNESMREIIDKVVEYKRLIYVNLLEGIK